MGRAREESDSKSQLVREICAIAIRSVTCTHRRPSHPTRTPFVDWYHLLQVEEDAGIDVIRKQYRRLALQLHPDKNKHPKAEVAFKLVSEAYTSLSDEAKRKAFDFKRWERFCVECKKIPYETPASLDASKLKGFHVRECRRSEKEIFPAGLRCTGERFKEEARVIQNCMKVHSASRKEFPVFDPSNYSFQGYPHHRPRIYNKANEIWLLKTESKRFCDRGKCESPIFEMGPERRSFQRKSACLGTFL